MRSTAGVRAVAVSGLARSRKMGIQVAALIVTVVSCIFAPAAVAQLQVEPSVESAPFSVPTSPYQAMAEAGERQDFPGGEPDLEFVMAPAVKTVFHDGFEGSFPGPWSVLGGTGVRDTGYRAYAGTRSVACTESGDDQSWMVYGPFSLSDASGGTFSFRYWNRSEPGIRPAKFLVSMNGIDFYGYQVSGDSGGWRSGSIDLAAVPDLGDVTGQPEVWIALVLPCGGDASNEAAYVDEVRVQKTTLLAGSDIRIDPLNLTYNQTSTRPIYVELDWMEDGTHSHRPSQAVIDRIVQTFAAAGFKINIDVSNAITHQTTLAISNYPSGSSSVQSIMSANFNHSGDSRYYYSIWGHNYSYNGTFTTSSGIADLPGRVHLVTLGSFPGQIGTFSHQVGAFIHEFGHNIGQRHGGADDNNYKPNYLSVMNYHYTLAGVGPTLLALGFANTGSGFDDFSYSHGLMPSLNESSLNENFGIGLGKAVDWNCSGTFTTGLAKDIQASNPCTASGGLSTLTDFDNWTSLASQIRTFGVSDETPMSKSTPCVTWEEFLPTYQKVEQLRRNGLLPPDGPGPELPISADGMSANFFLIYNDGTDPLSVTSIALDIPTTWVKWEPQAPFTVQPGASQKVHVYVDFGQAFGGTTTRRILVQSNDADESPYPGGVNLSITSTNPLACYTLTRSHTGSGSDPVASPTNSAGCAAGQYNAGASISVTASPAAGSNVAGWSGTTNNASTSTTNTVTMPASNHTASVQYVLACYTLTRSHTGSGSDPVASPTNSAGCATGQYNAGASISVTASPSAGSNVAGWSGTTNNASTSTTNTVTMPVGNHTVSVQYVLACYTLTLSHTGSGSDPVASPTNSAGCAAGQYNAGASISLTASPAAGSNVASWSGTTNNASTSTTNTVTMPVGNHTASVQYVLACYTLTRSHTGSGSDPVASPTNSAGCAAGQYNAGASISVTASPSAGSNVASWSGTTNNASTSTTNTVTMPVGNHTASVQYVLACYTLTRSHTGLGGDPVESPTNSVGCAAGQYNAGASISVTASPSAGSNVVGWTGTTNNASTSTTNTVTMPVGNHTVSVQYALACYTLTLSHTGSGGDPVASPTSSVGCAGGQYNAGASISVTANPTGDSAVAGWSGTINNASTSVTNTVTMPIGNHGVSVQYEVVPEVALANDVAYPDSFVATTLQGSWRYYYFDLEEGSTDLEITLDSLSQNADLYVRFNAKPTLGAYDCRPGLGGTTNEQCSISSPSAGRWWIGVNNAATGTLGYQVKARWLSPSMDFYTLVPCRIVDTRSGSPLSSGSPVVFQISGACGVPASARAIAFNLTALSPTGNGNVALWPANLVKPLTSAINFSTGITRANNGFMSLATDGSGTLSAESFVASQGTVNITIDITGYFQ